MRGNLVKLTMGDYLTDTIGFISALSYTIPQDSVWDIARNADGTKSKKDLALPHLIEVSSFNFTPITSFLPQKVSSNYIRKQTSKNMNAPFISLKNKEGYENTNPIIPQNAPDPGDGNVSIEEECKHLIKSAINKFGRIDVLVNNAGISMRASFSDLDISVL